MPKLPGISPPDAVRVFQKLGCRIARESGHIIMSNGKNPPRDSAPQSHQRHHHGRYRQNRRADAGTIPRIVVL